MHTPADRIEQIIDTNLTAPLVLTRFWLRRLLGKGRRGRLVNVTSICGQRGYPGLVAYSSTKGGLDAATRSLAREFSRPGAGQRRRARVLRLGDVGGARADPARGRSCAVRRPGRLTTPEEVVPVVRMLLLEDTNINGQSIVIDGAGSI